MVGVRVQNQGCIGQVLLQDIGINGVNDHIIIAIYDQYRHTRQCGIARAGGYAYYDPGWRHSGSV